MINDLIRQFEMMNQLAAVGRFSRDHMLKRESVLEHIGFVCLFSVFLGKKIEEGSTIKLDFGSLLTRAALHDIDEVIFGDIPRTTKYFSKEISAQFKIEEKKAILHLEKWLGVQFFEDWAEAKDSSIEGKIVALADLAAVVYKLWSEVSLYGNLSFKRIAQELEGFLLEAKGKYTDTFEFLELVTQMTEIVLAVKNDGARLRDETMTIFPEP